MSTRKLKALLVVLIILVLMCLGYLGWILYGYLKADQEYLIVRDLYVSTESNVEDKAETGDGTDEEHAEEKPYVSPIPYMDIDIDGLITENPDFLCWLYYADGKVDYPVVKEQENDVNGYLHKTFNWQKNSAGCIFMPYDASDDFSDLNTFLYGHNMRNGSMFGSLKLVYNSPAEKFNDPYFYIWTKDHEQIMYRIISMYVVDKDNKMYAVPSGVDVYDKYLNMVLGKGSTDGFIKFTEAEKQAMENKNPIVSFSVCYGAAGTRNRLLVQGVEVLREEYVR